MCRNDLNLSDRQVGANSVKQSDQDLHCLPFRRPMHLLVEFLRSKNLTVQVSKILGIFRAPQRLGFMYTSALTHICLVDFSIDIK